MTTRYLRGNVVDELWARIDGSNPYWMLADQQGSVRDIADETGAFVDTITFDAFGNITADSENRGC